MAWLVEWRLLSCWLVRGGIGVGLYHGGCPYAIPANEYRKRLVKKQRKWMIE